VPRAPADAPQRLSDAHRSTGRTGGKGQATRGTVPVMRVGSMGIGGLRQVFCTSACALAGGGGDEGAAAAAFQYVNPRALITHRLSWTQIVSGEGLSARGGRKLERHVR